MAGNSNNSNYWDLGLENSKISGLNKDFKPVYGELGKFGQLRTL